LIYFGFAAQNGPGHICDLEVVSFIVCCVDEVLTGVVGRGRDGFLVGVVGRGRDGFLVGVVGRGRVRFWPTRPSFLPLGGEVGIRLVRVGEVTLLLVGRGEV